MKYYNLLALLFFFAFLSCGEKKSKDISETAMETALPEEKNEVSLMTLNETDFHHELVSNGKLSARRSVNLRFQSTEPIAAIYVKNGDRVVKGQKLAELSTFRLRHKTAQSRDALERARLELQDVLIGQGYMLEDSAKVPEATMKLVRIKSGYDQTLSQYQLALYEEEHATLVAPFDGLVANLFAKEQNTASTSEVFCTIIDPRSLEASFPVLESELPLIGKGDKVEVIPYASTDNKVEGQITEINPIVDANGMVQVRASVVDKGKLFEGMNVRVSIKRSVPKQLIVPKSAVVLRSNKQVVFTLVNGKAYWNYVHTGLENTGYYTITDGLNPGDEVITSGNINLAHEAPVTVVDKSTTVTIDN